VKLLLDTHVWLWSLLDPQKLRRRLIRQLEDPANELWLSPICTWEVVMLAEKKRIEISGDLAQWMAAALTSAPIREAPLTHEVALETRRVRLAHKDPADRFLVATARVFNLTLVTADRRLAKTRDIAVLPAR
jgi:PIN domain nuclease of toxin-antitoxin system